MKVKDILEQLNKLSPEEDLAFWMDDGCCGDFMELNLYDISVYDHNHPALGAMRFSTLPGYKSCIQSSNTKKSDEKYWAEFKKPNIENKEDES